MAPEENINEEEVELSPEDLDEIYQQQEKKAKRNLYLKIAAGIALVVIVIFWDAVPKGFFKPKKEKSSDVGEVVTVKEEITSEHRDAIHMQVRVHLDHGRINDAKDTIIKLLERDPENFEGHYLAGSAYLRLGDVTRAYAYTNKAVELKPDYFQAIRRLGEINLLAGQFPEARALAVKLQESVDYAAEGIMLDSEIDNAQGNPEKALERALEAFRSSKKELAVKWKIYLADLYQRNKKPLNAEETISTIERAGLDAEELIGLANYFVRIREGKKAIAIFDETIANFPDNSEVHYSYGQYLFRARNYKKAAEQYAKADELTPGIDAITYRLVEAQLSNVDFKNAKFNIDKMLNANQDSDLALWLLVRYQVNTGGRKAALGTLKRISTLQPDSLRPYTLSASLYMQEGQGAMAVKSAQKALAINKDLASAHLVIGEVNAREGKNDVALTHFEAVLKTVPNNLTALLNSGDIYLQKGDIDKAHKFYTEAINKYPKLNSLNLKLATVKAAAGDKKGALAITEKYYKKAPKDAKALAGYVNELVNNGQGKQALALVENRVKNDSSDWAAWFILGDLKIREGKQKDAVDAFTRAAAVDKRNVNLRLNIASRYELFRMYKEAEKVYKSVLDDYPGNLLVSNQLAWLYVDSMDEPKKAMELISVLKGGEGPRVFDTIGWYYYKIKDLKGAEYYLREALRQEPKNEIIKGHLALALIENGDKTSKTEAEGIVSTIPDGPLKKSLLRVLAVRWQQD